MDTNDKSQEELDKIEKKKLAHREYAKQYYQKHYAKNKEALSYNKEYKQEYYRQYYQKTRDKIIERATEWNKVHRNEV
jgi:hypothetical protein